ncbi:GD22344 [Drosophila simulans]|uniref:GD22344 n=1 Tax=Drosophila simulans TaxID=7240 RepID=B4Q7V1_DROSI|nr:GD22344 [Drosophila simulans]
MREEEEAALRNSASLKRKSPIIVPHPARASYRRSPVARRRAERQREERERQRDLQRTRLAAAAAAPRQQPPPTRARPLPPRPRPVQGRIQEEPAEEQEEGEEDLARPATIRPKCRPAQRSVCHR